MKVQTTTKIECQLDTGKTLTVTQNKDTVLISCGYAEAELTTEEFIALRVAINEMKFPTPPANIITPPPTEEQIPATIN